MSVTPRVTQRKLALPAAVLQARLLRVLSEHDMEQIELGGAAP